MSEGRESMNDELTDEEWREFQAIPDQGFSHRHWVDAKIQERLARPVLSADNREALWELADEFLAKANIEDVNQPSLSEMLADMIAARFALPVTPEPTEVIRGQSFTGTESEQNG